MPQVGIIMGSTSDLPIMQQAIDILTSFDIDVEVDIVSAHRTPEKLFDYSKNAHSRGLKVIIAGAGGAAHLPGMVASLSPLPVIGVPVKSTCVLLPPGPTTVKHIRKNKSPSGILTPPGSDDENEKVETPAELPVILIFAPAKLEFNASIEVSSKIVSSQLIENCNAFIFIKFSAFTFIQNELPTPTFSSSKVKIASWL